jgi:hypothetical protein
MSYVLPYTEARILRVEIGDQAAKFKVVGAGTFEVAAPVVAASPLTLRVTWEVALSALEDAARGYRARLQTLAPVSAYAVIFALDQDSAYEFERTPNRREAEIFSIASTGANLNNDFGTCGIGLRRRDPIARE